MLITKLITTIKNNPVEGMPPQYDIIGDDGKLGSVVRVIAKMPRLNIATGYNLWDVLVYVGPANVQVDFAELSDNRTPADTVVVGRHEGYRIGISATLRIPNAVGSDDLHALDIEKIPMLDLCIVDEDHLHTQEELLRHIHDCCETSFGFITDKDSGERVQKAIFPWNE